MNTVAHSSANEIVLSGLSGGNLLAFLTAVGTLRTVSLAMPDENVRMSWRPLGGAWRPVLHFRSSTSAEKLLETLAKVFEPFQNSPGTHPAMLWHHWVPRNTWQRLAAKPGRPDAPLWKQWLDEGEALQTAVTGSSSGSFLGNRERVDWLAGIGTESALAEGEDSDSVFRAPRSDYFIGNLLNIIANTGTAHVDKALFKPWAYDDPMDNLSLKFDASEDRRYALQWSAPSGDPDRKKRGNMLGASRLAIEALPHFPTVVDGTRLATTGFTGKRSTREFTWGLWDAPARLDTVRTLLALADLRVTAPDTHRLRASGIAAIFRCRRETIGKTRIFTPARAI